MRSKILAGVLAVLAVAGVVATASYHTLPDVIVSTVGFSS